MRWLIQLPMDFIFYYDILFPIIFLKNDNPQYIPHPPITNPFHKCNNGNILRGPLSRATFGLRLDLRSNKNK